MGRNQSAFELMVGSITGKYLAPLKEGQIDFSEAVYVSGPCLLKDGRYPIMMECVSDEEYKHGEVIASIRWLRERHLVGNTPIRQLKDYVVLTEEEVFSHFPDEHSQSQPKCIESGEHLKEPSQEDVAHVLEAIEGIEE